MASRNCGSCNNVKVDRRRRLCSDCYTLIVLPIIHEVRNAFTESGEYNQRVEQYYIPSVQAWYNNVDSEKGMWWIVYNEVDVRADFAMNFCVGPFMTEEAAASYLDSHRDYAPERKPTIQHQSHIPPTCQPRSTSDVDRFLHD